MGGPVPGAPCWVSLTTRDTTAAERFYGSVLGWSFGDSAVGPGFRLATDGDGEPVAGLNATDVAANLPVHWMVFFAVDDADLTGQRITERGATVAVGPLEVGDGRAVVAADRDFAAFGLWQGPSGEPDGPRAHVAPPAEWRLGKGSAPVWLERHSVRARTAALFYDEVFDWSGSPGFELRHRLEPEPAVRLLVEGESVAAFTEEGAAGDGPDDGLPPRWDVFFAVADVDDAVRATERAGGEVVVRPRPTAYGTGATAATLRDPDGALFSVATRRP